MEILFEKSELENDQNIPDNYTNHTEHLPNIEHPQHDLTDQKHVTVKPCFIGIKLFL